MAKVDLAKLLILTGLIVGVSFCIEASPMIGSCLQDCQVCQVMYGEHFIGHCCAKTCLKTFGAIKPDCNDLKSIAPCLDDSVLAVIGK